MRKFVGLSLLAAMFAPALVGCSQHAGVVRGQSPCPNGYCPPARWRATPVWGTRAWDNPACTTAGIAVGRVTTGVPSRSACKGRTTATLNLAVCSTPRSRMFPPWCNIRTTRSRDRTASSTTAMAEPHSLKGVGNARCPRAWTRERSPDAVARHHRRVRGTTHSQRHRGAMWFAPSIIVKMWAGTEPGTPPR